MKRLGFVCLFIGIGLAACSRDVTPSDGLSYTGGADDAAIQAFRADFVDIAAANEWAVTDTSSLDEDGILHILAVKDCLIAIADGSVDQQILSFDFHDICEGGQRTDDPAPAFAELIETYALEASPEHPPIPHAE